MMHLGRVRSQGQHSLAATLTQALTQAPSNWQQAKNNL
jgi:hypothetical protein